MRLVQLSAIIVTMISLSAALDFKCEFVQKKFHDSTPEMYTCNALDLSTEDDSYITEVTGKHADGKTNENVIQMHVINQNVEYFPGGLKEIFPNLEAIVIKNSTLKCIFHHDLVSFPKLKYVNLQDNQIEVLGPKLFEGNSDLTEIYLERNRIKNIRDDLIDPLEHLTVIRLAENVCIEKDLEVTPVSMTDVKSQIIAKCPFSIDNWSETVENETEKLMKQIKTLEDELKTAKKIPENVTEIVPAIDAEEAKRLQDRVMQLELHESNLLLHVELSNQTLEENAVTIKTISDENEVYKANNENLTLTLAEALNTLEETSKAKENLEKKEISLNIDIGVQRSSLIVFLDMIKMLNETLTRETENSETLIAKLTAENSEKEQKITNLTATVETSTKENKAKITKLDDDIKSLRNVNKALNLQFTKAQAKAESVKKQCKLDIQKAQEVQEARQLKG